MAANTVVKSQTAVGNDLGNTTLNPVGNQPTNSATREVYHITLVVENLNLDPAKVFNSLKTIGADVSAVTPVVTIQSPKDILTRRTWILNIGPT